MTAKKAPAKKVPRNRAEPKALEDLVPDRKNARRHTPRNLDLIRQSMQVAGSGRSILIDERSEILAGNATTEMAIEQGMRLKVVDAEPDEIVAVRRRGLTKKQKAQLALFDNRAAEEAEWDIDALKSLREEGVLEGIWSDDEIERLFSDLEASIKTGGGGDEFEAKPKDGPTIVQAGEVWKLGRHRLVCGDATSPENVARLLGGSKPRIMVTDPPYGVDYDPKWRNEAAAKGSISSARRRTGKVANDDRVSWREVYELFPGSVVYVWHGSVFGATVALDLTGFEVRSQIIWAKNRFAISRGHYHWQHEAAWYAVRKGATAAWCGDRSQTTLREIAVTNDGHKNDHSTQKPIECMERPLRNHKGDVYDPFLGSGTTMIAAERLGRRCFGMELEPKWCDVVIDRWELETGRKAERLEAE